MGHIQRAVPDRLRLVQPRTNRRLHRHRDFAPPADLNPLERRHAQVPVWVVHSPQLDVRGAGHQQLQVRPVRVQASGVKPSIRFASFESVESLQWTRALEVP